MKKFLTAFVVLTGFSLALTAEAATVKKVTPAQKTETVKKVATVKKTETVKKATTAKKAATAKTTSVTKKTVNHAPAKPPVVSNDVSGLKSSHYSCELGNQFTVYKKSGEADHVNLNWHNKMYQLARQNTTTGAERYEDKYNGLVWINIPAKSMLLDTKHGRQLANECRNAEQRQAALQLSKK